MASPKSVKHNSIALRNGKSFRVNPAKPLNYQELIQLKKTAKLWKEDYRKFLFELAKRDPVAAKREIEGYLKNVEIRKTGKIASGRVKPAKPLEVVD